MSSTIDTCLSGYGVVCGAEVNLNPDCSLQAAEGTVIMPDGSIQHISRQLFRYYVRPQYLSDGVKKAMFTWLKITDLDPNSMEFLQLAEDGADPNTIDSLKQQHPDDIPEQNLMYNKIMATLVLTDDKGAATVYWLLVSRDAIARAMGFTSSGSSSGSGLFSRSIGRKEIDLPTLDAFLRPILKLPVLAIPRLGYKQLALVQASKGLTDDNLQFPYGKVQTFSEIFFEYKAIIDDFILKFRDALNVLHDNFGPLLSHKGATYLEQYRKILLLKLSTFYEAGDHLYYMQYFYDWLRDLTLAYQELVIKLEGFRGGCPCSETKGRAGETGVILLLGPVLGGRTTYQPLVFRDLAGGPETDRSIRELRCMHWRLLMMIRTFDLPMLRLDKALQSFIGSQGIEEQLDSTDYWEYINSLGVETEEEHNFLPVKFTPTRGSIVPLGRMAIPYYYPLDSNSIYSVHQFWDYETTVLRQIDTLLSYNAHVGDSSKPSTDVVNDSYTSRVEVILPLAFNIEPYPFLKPEGHIGKHLTLVGNTFYLKSFPLLEYLHKYNLCVDVVAVALPGTGGGADIYNLSNLFGMEHRPALPQGYTLVLLYTGSDEQIELQECKKDTWPEIAKNTIVADFVLPGCLSCYTADANVMATLVAQPNINP